MSLDFNALVTKVSHIVMRITSYFRSPVDILYVYGGGTAYTDATITAAINDIGSTSSTIKLAPGTWIISNDITIPSNISIIIPKGAIASVASGKTLTINGPLDDGLWQKFSGSGSVLGIGSGKEFCPQWWGAIGDGVTNDSVAFNAALTASNFIRLPYTPAGYFLGTITDTNKTGLALTGKVGVTIFSEGATLKVSTNSPTGAQQHAILQFIDCSNVSILGKLNFQSDLSVQQFGPDAIQIQASSADSNNFYFQHINATFGSAAIRVTNGSNNPIPHTYKVRDIKIDVLNTSGTYYGYLGEAAGNNVLIDRLITDSTLRSFYVQGVDNVEANIESHSHGSSTGDVLIGTYYNDTRNIKVRYLPYANTSPEYLVRIVHYKTVPPNEVNGPASGKVIENIDIYYDDENTVPGGSGGNNWGITLREDDTLGGAQTTSPHIMRNIKISGKFTRPYVIDSLINTPTNFAQVGRLYIDQSFFQQESLGYSFHGWLRGNPLNSWTVHMGGNKWARNIIGNLETQTLQWSCLEAAGGVMSAKVTLSIVQDYTKTVSGGGISVLLRDYGVFGSVSNSTGYFSYLSSAQLSTASGGGYAPSITFTGAGSNQYLVCTLTSANGATPANGRALGIIEFF